MKNLGFVSTGASSTRSPLREKNVCTVYGTIHPTQVSVKILDPVYLPSTVRQRIISLNQQENLRSTN
jgi:hypothetical protein